MVYKVGQLGEPEKFHRRRIHLIPHPGDGIPWRQNFSSGYGPDESIFPPKRMVAKSWTRQCLTELIEINSKSTLCVETFRQNSRISHLKMSEKRLMTLNFFVKNALYFSYLIFSWMKTLTDVLSSNGIHMFKGFLLEVLDSLC